MTSSEMKKKVDNIWLQFWTGGVTNPLTVIEQITYLIFARMLDIQEDINEKRFKQGKIFSKDKQHIRWNNLRTKPSAELLPIVRDELFPFLRERGNNGNGQNGNTNYLKDATLMIVKESLLSSVVELISELPLKEGDTKGDLYEYLLSKLTTSGIAGQFRTPRHIIKMMVELVDVKPDQKICDPACGTGGFLVEAYQHLKREYTSPEMVIEEIDEATGEKQTIYPADKLTNYNEHIQKELLTGFDFDSTMLRIAAMNLMLHGIDSPRIVYQDTLSNSFLERQPRLCKEYFDVILANPPFKGSLDDKDVEPSLTGKVKTKKTELLFNTLFLRMLVPGGTAAVIVPDGVLFGASKAHLALRKMIVEENELKAVISLPSGVFKPYAGVSTAILIFTKGGRTDNVWYYDVENDGLSLDDKRNPTPNQNDIPDVIEKWKNRNLQKDVNKKNKAFFVSKKEIVDTNYDLSISRYRIKEFNEITYDTPNRIIEKMIEKEIGSKNQDEILKQVDGGIAKTLLELREIVNEIK